jgi:acetylornithine/N-succinyldiaminopimelate aminotransferase
MRNSFHGRTLATLTATGQSKVQKGFEPLPSGFVYADFNNLDSVKSAITDKTAAVLVEPIQGEGGVIPADKDFLQGLRALCDEKNILLLFDEVQCGMGRTGAWFAFQNYNVLPDAFSLAKALAGGFPMGAVVAAPKVADVLQAGKHASTFGGGPVVCAAALATIKAIQEEGLLQNARDMGAKFMLGLQALVDKYDHLKEVRGAGLMIGLVLDKPAKELEAKLMEIGLLALATAEKVLRFLPPLNVKPGEIDEALEILDDVCAEWHGAPAEPAAETTT